MTENTTPERAAMLRREAANIFGRADFDPPGQWPEAFPARALAALMAGGSRNEHKAEYQRWQRRIMGAIAEGALQTRVETEQPPPKRVERPADGLTGRQAWRRHLHPATDGIRPRLVYTETVEQQEIVRHFVARKCFAAWLEAIRENPSEHVEAWLGAEWQGGATKATREPTPASPREPSKAEERNDAIVTAARRLGYDPAKVAWGGKAAIKQECLKDAKLFTASTFDKAWQAARKAGLVDVEDVETYRGR